MRGLIVVALVGCSFSTNITSENPGDAAVADAPPTTAAVRFVAITSTTMQLRPGLYGIEVVATLQNDLATPITDLAVTLTISAAMVDRSADFRWRDADARENVMPLPPPMIGAGQQASFRFTVDALPWAVAPGPIVINGAATFLDGAMPLSATASDTPLALEVAAINAPIVVNAVTDEEDGDTNVCLREALQRAAGQAGLDRIVFDPAVFPAAAPVVTLLSDGLGEIVISQDVVIDGRGAGVIVAVDSSWENDGRYAFKIASGNVVISGITFRNFGFGYPNEGDLSANNCGSNNMSDGGAIRIDNGQLVLEGNTFEDPAVAERNCYAASVRLEGGTRHRILNNVWTEQSMDAIYVDASTIEISGNLMNAGGNASKVDECIFIATQGGAPLWITNNICVDQEYSAVVANGSDGGALFVVNNTFVRNGRTDLSALRRSGNRTITLRNNVYVNNNPAAINLDTNGTGFDVAFEAHFGSPLFNGASTGATVSAGTIANLPNASVVDGAGATRAALTPVAGGALVGSGLDLIDVNGKAPNRHNGNGPERGAVELP